VDEVPPANFKAAIATSFDTQRQDSGRATTTKEVVLLESAIEASVGGDAEREDKRLYPKARWRSTLATGVGRCTRHTAQR
jgi:hypothetical protein